jgi:hypothetical protein
MLRNRISRSEHDRNGNVTFTISTKHLAAPERLTPAKNSYVVWIRPTDGQPQNAGALRINNELEVASALQRRLRREETQNERKHTNCYGARYVGNFTC